MYIYYLIYTYILLLSAGNSRTSSVRFLLTGFILFVFAALRGNSVDRDYLGYIDYYSNILQADFINVEPTFIYLTRVVEDIFQNPIWLFFIYAALGIGLKMLAINRMTKYKILTLVVYFSGHFLIWEMTQIRIAVAGGIFLLSTTSLLERNIGRYFFYCCLAALFHYTALIMFLFFFINGENIKKAYYSALIPLGFLLLLANIDLSQLAPFAPVNLIEIKINSYENAKSTSDTVINVIFLCRCLLAYFLLAFSTTGTKSNLYYSILLKFYFIGLFCNLALSPIPGIATRISEFLLITEALLIPMILDVLKPKSFGYLIIVLISTSFLTFSLPYSGLLQPYYVNTIVSDFLD